MENDLRIKFIEYSSDGYSQHSIVLKALTSITPWGDNDFLWQGDYKGKIIKVKLKRWYPGETSIIDKPNDLNITDEIISEVNRVIRKLN
jgi:hypothetical protein